jgi:putative oxidoreductase
MPKILIFQGFFEIVLWRHECMNTLRETPEGVAKRKGKHMKTTATISRILLGITFTVFGLNGFLHFIPAPPASPLAAQFFGALVESHYMAVVFAIQRAGGIALLLNRMTPLTLAVLGPVIFNILLFHITMAPAGLPLPIVVLVLWSIVAYSVRPAFAGLFTDGAVEESPRRADRSIPQHA